MSRFCATGLVMPGQEKLWEDFWSNRTPQKRNLIFEENSKLIGSTLNRRMIRSLTPELIEECKQEAAVGLINAIEEFDPEKRCQFSTYAVLHIRGEVSRYLDNSSRTIRQPAHIHQLIRKMGRAEAEFTAKYGRSPNQDAELADFMGVSLVSLSKIRQLNQNCIVSLDASLSNEPTETIGDSFTDPNAINPMEEALNLSPLDELRIQELPTRTREVLRLYCEEQDLKIIAWNLNISEYRARKILNDGISALRKQAGNHAVPRTKT